METNEDHPISDELHERNKAKIKEQIHAAFTANVFDYDLVGNELAPERPKHNWKQMDTELMLLRGRVTELDAEVEDYRFTITAILKTIGGKIIIQPKTLQELPRNTIISCSHRIDGAMMFSIQSEIPTEVSDGNHSE